MKPAFKLAGGVLVAAAALSITAAQARQPTAFNPQSSDTKGTELQPTELAAKSTNATSPKAKAGTKGKGNQTCAATADSGLMGCPG